MYNTFTYFTYANQPKHYELLTPYRDKVGSMFLHRITLNIHLLQSRGVVMYIPAS